MSNSTKMVRRNRGNAECELIFEAQLPALGYEQLQVSCDSRDRYSSTNRYEKVFAVLHVTTRFHI